MNHLLNSKVLVRSYHGILIITLCTVNVSILEIEKLSPREVMRSVQGMGLAFGLYWEGKKEQQTVLWLGIVKLCENLKKFHIYLQDA